MFPNNIWNRGIALHGILRTFQNPLLMFTCFKIFALLVSSSNSGTLSGKWLREVFYLRNAPNWTYVTFVIYG